MVDSEMWGASLDQCLYIRQSNTSKFQGCSVRL